MDVRVESQRSEIVTCASLADGLRLFSLAGIAGADVSPKPPGPLSSGARSAVGSAEHGKPRLVLVVDDDVDILESYAHLIERSVRGVVVRTAPNAQRALELLKAESFALIVSDYRMPGMNGIDFLIQAHRLQPDAARILVSAYRDRELEVRAQAEVGPNFLSKASDPSLLLKRIHVELSAP